MARPKVKLDPTEWAAVLEQVSLDGASEIHRRRAGMLLDITRGLSDVAVAASRGVSPSTVARLRRTFAKQGQEALAHLPREGRPRVLADLSTFELEAILRAGPEDGADAWTFASLGQALGVSAATAMRLVQRENLVPEMNPPRLGTRQLLGLFLSELGSIAIIWRSRWDDDSYRFLGTLPNRKTRSTVLTALKRFERLRQIKRLASSNKVESILSFCTRCAGITDGLKGGLRIVYNGSPRGRLAIEYCLEATGMRDGRPLEASDWIEEVRDSLSFGVSMPESMLDVYIALVGNVNLAAGEVFSWGPSPRAAGTTGV